MPTISLFYGIIVSMYFLDNRQHQMPHIHVRYQDDEAVYSIPEGELLSGAIPPAKDGWCRPGSKFTATISWPTGGWPSAASYRTKSNP